MSSISLEEAQLYLQSRVQTRYDGHSQYWSLTDAAAVKVLIAFVRQLEHSRAVVRSRKLESVTEAARKLVAIESENPLDWNYGPTADSFDELVEALRRLDDGEAALA